MKKEILYLGYVIKLSVEFNDSEYNSNKIYHRVRYEIFKELKRTSNTSYVSACSSQSLTEDVLIDIINLQNKALEWVENSRRVPVDKSVIEQLRDIGFKSNKEA